MTAYDVGAWSEFGVAVLGGAAALAGLLFVAASLNIEEVLRYSGVPARSAATLGLLVSILLTATFLVTPDQPRIVVAVELVVVGVAMLIGAIYAAARYTPRRSSAMRRRRGRWCRRCCWRRRPCC